MCLRGLLMWSVSWIFVWTISLCVCIHAGIYIPKRNYTFYISNLLNANDVIGIIRTTQHNAIKCDNSSVDIATSPSSDDIFAEFEDKNILIRVSNNFNVTDTVVFDLNVNCANESFFLITNYQPLMTTKVVLKVDYFQSSNDTSQVITGSGSSKASSGDTLCLRNEDLLYNVIENTKPGIIDVFGMNRLPAAVSLSASSQSDNNLYFNVTSGELVLRRSPDREESPKHNLGLLCSVKGNAGVVLTVTVIVLDANDNPPFTEYKKDVQFRDHADKNKTVLQTFDNDANVGINSYRMYTNDSLGVVVLGGSTFKSLPITTLISTDVKISPHNLSTPYIVDVTVEDLTYEPNDRMTNLSNKAIHRLTIPPSAQQTLTPEEQTKTVSLDITAARYSLVINLGLKNRQADSNSTKYEIKEITPIYLEKMLAVTNTGNVFINDTVQLSSYNMAKLVTATVIKSEANGRRSKFLLSINVNNNTLSTSLGKCETGCSIHSTEGSCQTSCGYGVRAGLCMWRNGELTMSVNYSTCSPYLKTCPDGFCSDLEKLNFFNCPQDCSMYPIHGQLIKFDNEQGIPRAKGPCWCDSKPTDGKTHCTCQPPRVSTFNTSNPAGRISDPIDKGTGGTSPHIGSNDEACSLTCRAAITGSVIAFVGAVLLALIGWRIWSRRRRRHAMSLKHVSSLVSMTAIPSDYIVDDTRDIRNHVNRLTSSPASTHWPMKLGFGQDMFDVKWEFQRQHLTLEHVIGEGEFGQVVRAQAFMLRGQEGKTVVAVKMLKPDASGAEYQDLVSEFQLLKEVSHPNVIQLLGVCTQKGPIYVIVEYCELGSLRNFLRSSKFKNKVSWDEKMRTENDSQSGADTAEVRVLTCRDFFSFAWQIAKGMDYLAGLKIVHRDLAARNVLVTDGLKMKISDFGLSRDVYEADTYLKMSKGRIPVKWMAPESLYGQIYTTKSDIWSFGIVLWEIVTLGASPYPGIPPERLFPLLSTGYRMDRPEDCPDELYAIMQKCWKLEPENRPHFSVLRDILDKLLQQNTEYLDLSDNNYLLHGTSSGFSTLPSSEHYTKSDDPCPSTQPTTKPQYSNIYNLNHCPPNVYVTTHWEGDDQDNEECPELSKLLGNKEITEAQTASTKQFNMNKIEKDLRDGKVLSEHILVHENLTYV